MLVGGFAAIRTINSCHLLSIFVPSTLPTLYLHHPYLSRSMCCHYLHLVGDTGACVDLESLFSLHSEEYSSWPHFESGGPSLGSPSNPWPWVSPPPLFCPFSLAEVFCSKLVLGPPQVLGLLYEVTSLSNLKGSSPRPHTVIFCFQSHTLCHFLST